MAQPDNILLNFQNAETLPGQNTMYYFYNDGQIQISGSNNLDEPKSLDLTNALLSKTTRIKSRTDTLTSPYVTTDDGVSIPFGANDEVYICHNYTGDTALTKSPNSNAIANSWYYDTDKHRAYRIYLVIGYDKSWNIGGITYYNWQLKNAYLLYRAAEDDPNDGTYTFTTIPTKPVSITGSVKLESTDGFNTWPQVTLRVYKNSSIISSETISGTSTKDYQLTTQTELQPADFALNDQIKMSVEVGGNESLIIDALEVPSYTMSFNTEAPPEENSFLGVPSELNLNEVIDCQPTFNNANDIRLNTFVQDVDYSVDIVSPINLKVLRNHTALKAGVPDSNYTQYSHTLNRYWGVKTNKTNFNTGSFQYADWDQRGNSIGSGINYNVSPLSLPSSSIGVQPNVEHLNSYIGYFNKIVDPYPVLNGKTVFYVKFVVDRNTEAFDPSLSDTGFYNFIHTYKQLDSNGKATEVKPSVTDVGENRELGDLAQFAPVDRVAEFPFPIFYSQNTSNDHVTSIPVTGSDMDYRDIASPFWQKTGSSINIGSNALQAVIDSGSFYNGEIEYTPGPNNAFPLGTEPDFTRFPGATDIIGFQIGDEIRFENNERETYRINGVTTGSIGGDTRTILTLDKEVGDDIDLDFFIVRRFKESPNILILDIQKPYDIPISASSAPGILTTRYQTAELQTNPDTVVNALVEKGLI